MSSLNKLFIAGIFFGKLFDIFALRYTRIMVCCLVMKKLNMLESGTLLLKIIGGLSLVSLVLYLCSAKTIAIIFLMLAFLVFVFLLVLLFIEQWQDRKQYEEAKKKDPEIK